MKKLLVLISTMTLWTACSSIQQPATDLTHREVTTVTMESILNDKSLTELNETLTPEQRTILTTWLKTKVIPYICYLEVELENSTK